MPTRFSRLTLLLKYIAVMVVAASLWGCGRDHNAIMERAERVAVENPDSALSLLEEIEPSDLPADSLKARYYLAVASIHDLQDHVLLSDSMVRFSAEYYKGKDLRRAIRSASLAAMHDFRKGDGAYALAQLDSLSNLPGLPDSLAVIPLRERIYIDDKISGTHDNSLHTIRLISIDKDSTWRDLYRHMLYIDYLNEGKLDSALVELDQLIGKSISDKSPTSQFSYEYEKIGVLEELGRHKESLELADKFIEKAPGNSIMHYIHLWKALTLMNMGKRDEALSELNRGDSCVMSISEDERAYYNGFAQAIRSAVDLQKTGRLSLLPLANVYNSQKDNLFRVQAIQHETEQNALKSENKRLKIKAERDRQFAVIVILVLAVLLVSGMAVWYSLSKRRRAIEAEERSEALRNMVEELKASVSSSDGHESLRRAMLQQLGVIKMVAETPTEQNREMLRRISSIGADTKGALVDWNNVYEMIDNLYSGFHSRLRERYGDVLADKERQIVVLMLAGFSTKEISVITSQSAATVYVRKSSVRKKLGVPEKDDIIAFIRLDMQG